MRLLVTLLLATSLSWGAYGFKRPVTIQASQVAGTSHTDFPALISFTNNDLRTTANGGNVQDADGDDIGFFSDSALTTALAWDLVRYNATTGQVIAYVKIGTLSGSVDTEIWIAYGDAALTTYQSTRANVWSNSYAAVWHTNDLLTDVSGNSNNLAITGTDLGFADGQIARSRNTTRSVTGAYVSAPDSASLDITGALTITCWVYPNTAVGNLGLVAKSIVGTNQRAYGLVMVNTQLRGFVSTNGTALATDFTSTLATATVTWNHVAMVFTPSTTLALFRNASKQSTATAAATLFNSSAGVAIGTFVDYGVTTSWGLDGRIGSVTIASAARADDWITTEFNMGNSPGTFIALGAEQALSGGGRRVFIIQ